MKRSSTLRRMAAYAVLPLLLVMALVCLAGPSAAENMTKQDLVREAKTQISEITVDVAKAKLEKGGTYFLDVREINEFQQGHVPGAIHLPRGLLEFKIAATVPEKDADIVIYCRSGGRGCLSVNSIQRMGYAKAVNMAGGWKAWVKADYPVE